ncbi:MAG: hypothetical protein ACD_45C00680G0004 [uncultured bacterium]|nr:MAG: hypothetical protein ACD_45C00680G0004 [uncultured bacterium]
MKNPSIFVPIILSGGTGSRLWPVSREMHPKPFVKLADGQSLLQKVFLRAHYLPNVTEIITITNKEYYFKSKMEYEKNVWHEILPHSFLLEPCARNTAPAIALAVLRILAIHGPDAVLLILPADHLIENQDAFLQACQQAFSLAKINKIVTLGILPASLETGFGYIECGDSLGEGYQVAAFIEKPTAELAEMYLQSKKYLWNAGMFCCKAGVMFQELKQHAPDLLQAAELCWERSQKNNTDFIELDEASFALLPTISIDYAVMEKSQEVAVIAAHFDWQDIGSWEAYKKLHQADSNGNTILGDAILIDSQDNFIHSEDRMIASIGINNLAIVDTPDALLITQRGRTQDVRQIVQKLKENAHESYLTHRTVTRPWGSYAVLETSAFYKIKRIVVKPQHSLSLQLHQYRSEHWVVVEGMANVINGEQEYVLKTNESTFVPMKTPHRLSNPLDSDLIIIEVQTGSYLGEDDITRLEDVYGRMKE